MLELREGRPQPVDIVELTNVTVRLELLYKGIDCSEPQHGIVRHVYGRRGDILRIIINILRDAEEALGPDGGRVNVRIRDEGRMAAIIISDNGTGMSPDKLQAFREGRSVGTTKGPGHGHGLNIVRRLIKRNGGSVEVESEEGRGTTVTLRLPVASWPMRLLYRLGLRPEGIAGLVGGLEEIIYSGLLVSGWRMAVELYHDITLSNASLAYFSVLGGLVFLAAHALLGRAWYINKENKIESRKIEDKDLFVLALAALTIRFLYYDLMIFLPFGGLNVAVALPAAVILHAIYNGVIAPRGELPLAMLASFREGETRASPARTSPMTNPEEPEGDDRMSSFAAGRKIFRNGYNIVAQFKDNTTVVLTKEGAVKMLINFSNPRLSREEILTILSRDKNAELSRRAKIAFENKNRHNFPPAGPDAAGRTSPMGSEPSDEYADKFDLLDQAITSLEKGDEILMQRSLELGGLDWVYIGAATNAGANIRKIIDLTYRVIQDIQRNPDNLEDPIWKVESVALPWLESIKGFITDKGIIEDLGHQTYNDLIGDDGCLRQAEERLKEFITIVRGPDDEGTARTSPEKDESFYNDILLEFKVLLGVVCQKHNLSDSERRLFGMLFVSLIETSEYLDDSAKDLKEESAVQLERLRKRPTGETAAETIRWIFDNRELIISSLQAMLDRKGESEPDEATVFSIASTLFMILEPLDKRVQEVENLIAKLGQRRPPQEPGRISRTSPTQEPEKEKSQAERAGVIDWAKTEHDVCEKLFKKDNIHMQDLVIEDNVTVQTIKECADDFRKQLINLPSRYKDNPFGKRLRAWAKMDLNAADDLENFLVGTILIKGFSRIAYLLLAAYLDISDSATDERIIRRLEAGLSAGAQGKPLYGSGDITVEPISSLSSDIVDESNRMSAIADTLEKALSSTLNARILWLIQRHYSDSREKLLKALEADSKKEPRDREYPAVDWSRDALVEMELSAAIQKIQQLKLKERGEAEKDEPEGRTSPVTGSDEPEEKKSQPEAAEEITAEGNVPLAEKFAVVREIVWDAYNKIMRHKRAEYIGNPELFLRDLARELNVGGRVIQGDILKFIIAMRYFAVIDGVIQLSHKEHKKLMDDLDADFDLFRLGIEKPGVYFFLPENTRIADIAEQFPRGNEILIILILHGFLEMLCEDYDIEDPEIINYLGHASLDILKEELRYAQDLGCLQELISVRRERLKRYIQHVESQRKIKIPETVLSNVEDLYRTAEKSDAPKQSVAEEQEIPQAQQPPAGPDAARTSPVTESPSPYPSPLQGEGIGEEIASPASPPSVAGEARNDEVMEDIARQAQMLEKMVSAYLTPEVVEGRRYQLRVNERLVKRDSAEWLVVQEWWAALKTRYEGAGAIFEEMKPNGKEGEEWVIHIECAKDNEKIGECFVGVSHLNSPHNLIDVSFIAFAGANIEIDWNGNYQLLVEFINELYSILTKKGTPILNSQDAPENIVRKLRERERIRESGMYLELPPLPPMMDNVERDTDRLVRTVREEFRAV